MASQHVPDLFSAAFDGELSSEQWLQFKEHLATCVECAAAYETFRTGVESVRLLPAARMPLPVHLPSGAPVAQRQTAAAWLRGLRRRVPLVPGGATAVAAVAAAAIALIALTHPATTPNPTTSASNPNTAAGRGEAGSAAQGACPSRAAAVPSAKEAAYSYRETKTDPSRPGQVLVIATDSATAAAGSQLVFYASLSVPLPTAGAPGAPASTAAAAVVPCLSVTGLPGSQLPLAVPQPPSFAAAANGAAAPQPASGTQDSSLATQADAGLQTITIPAGTPPGTVLHIVATVPAGFPSAGDPPLSIELTITVR